MADRFDAAFSHIGGRVEIANLPLHERDTFSQVEKLCAWHSRCALSTWSAIGKLEIGCVDSPNINAVAKELDGDRYIGIFAGAVRMICNLFRVGLSSKDVFPTVGDPNRELGIMEVHSLNDLSTTIHPEPRDHQRAQLAQDLFRNAMSFLIDHEVGHHLNGHVKFWSSVMAMEFAELGFLPKENQEALMRQTLEFDADSFAAQQTALRSLEKLTSDFRKSGFVAGLATNCLLRVFGIHSFSDAQESLASHPPISVRHTAVNSTFSTVALAREKCNAEEFADGVSKSIVAAEHLCRAVIGTHGWDGFQQAWKGDGWAYLQVLLAKWKNGLHDQLLPFAVGGLAPPQD